MRFRLTIILLVVNILLFVGIWILERDQLNVAAPAKSLIPFTTLEISGKGIEKPRILKLENNKWNIVSPIKWRASHYVVNRIRNQLEFLDREASFSIEEVSKHGRTLADYGLDDPAFVFRYGNGEKMHTLKVGKGSTTGDKVYVYDMDTQKIVIANKDFVNGLIVDIESLRNHFVFDIEKPEFEVSAFSIRLPTRDSVGLKADLKRIGLKREMGKWKFETPIEANADSREVEAFLNDICQTKVVEFVDSSENTGIDISGVSESIMLEGTNRRIELLLGDPTKDGKFRYARLEGNPTIFLVDALPFKNLESKQNALREKSFFKFDINKVDGIDISKGDSRVVLRKEKSNWTVIGGANGTSLTASADYKLVNDLLMKLKEVRANQFVSDIAVGDKKSYGIDENALKITIMQAGQDSITLNIGSEYKLGAARLRYASVDGSDSIYGISRAISEMASTDVLYYRSRVLEVLPKNAKITSLSLSGVRSGNVLFEIKSENGNFDTVTRTLSIEKHQAVDFLLDELRNFSVESYVDAKFSEKGFAVDGALTTWLFVMDLTFELQGTASSTVIEKRRWYFSKRGGTIQYGGTANPDVVFKLTQKNINALWSLIKDVSVEKEINKTAPSAPGNL